jgi:hypothetical protein
MCRITGFLHKYFVPDTVLGQEIWSKKARVMPSRSSESWGMGDEYTKFSSQLRLCRAGAGKLFLKGQVANSFSIEGVLGRSPSGSVILQEDTVLSCTHSFGSLQ